MSVVIAFEEAGPCRKKLTIEVPAPAVTAEWGRVTKDLKRQVQLPGFRRGKIPDSVLNRRFREDIEKEVVERLVPRYWRQAESEKSLDSLMAPQVEDLKIEPGETMSFVATVEVRPEITIGELAPFELPEENIEPTELEIEESFADLRQKHAKWETVDRAAGQGDLVIGTATDLGDPPAESGATETETPEAEEADGTEAGESEAPRRQPIRIEVGGRGVDEEISLAVTGLSAGQSTEVRQSPEEGEGPGRQIRIEVEEVQEAELPEMNDEFASLFGFDDIDSMQEAFIGSIRSGKERDLKQRRETALLEQLRGRYPVDLPEGVVAHEGEQMVRERFERLMGQGMEIDTEKIDWARVLDDARPHAQQRVHERLLLDAVGRESDAVLDESEFERVLSSLAKMQNVSSSTLRQRLSESGRLEGLRAQLLREQTLRQLLGETEQPVDEGEQTESGSSA